MKSAVDMIKACSSHPNTSHSHVTSSGKVFTVTNLDREYENLFYFLVQHRLHLLHLPNPPNPFQGRWSLSQPRILNGKAQNFSSQTNTTFTETVLGFMSVFEFTPYVFIQRPMISKSLGRFYSSILVLRVGHDDWTQSSSLKTV